MSVFLKVIAVLSVIGGIVLGLDDKVQLMGFTIYLIVAGVVQGAVFFSLSMILDRLAELREGQEYMKLSLEKIGRTTVKALPKKTCSGCGAEYEADYTSCPKCGRG